MSSSPDPGGAGGRAADFNLALLRAVATRIGRLRERVMFLGGTVLPLLVRGPAAAGIRRAKDVDLMIHAASKPELWEFEDELWDLGFTKTRTGATCHWILGDVHLDVLTTAPDTVDFVNHWGREAMTRARRCDLGGGLTVSLIRSTHYVATKFDAFYRRGNGSHHTSLDVHDILLVLRGCPDLEDDFHHQTSPELQTHLASELKTLRAAASRWQILPPAAGRPARVVRQWTLEAADCIWRLADRPEPERERTAEAGAGA